MLRWCLSTVRNMGGRRSVFPYVARSASTVQLAFQLNDSKHSPTTVQRASLPPTSYAAQSLLSVAVALPEHSPLTHATEDERSLPAVPVTSEVQESRRLENVATHSSAPSLAAGTLTIPRTGRHSKANGPSSLMKLKQLLSAMTSDAASATLHVPTPNTLLSLYRTIKANSHLHHLTSDEMSSLIAVFGSLSLSTPGRPYNSIHAHPWTGRIQRNRTCSIFWTQLLMLETDKLNLGQTLCSADHFWFMRAHLAQDDTEKNGPPAEEGAPSSRSATDHYRVICRTSSHPEIHVPYLRLLLKQPSRHVAAADVISELMERLPSIHSSILDCLWHLVLDGSTHLPTSSRFRLLAALHSRLTLSPPNIATHIPVVGDPNQNVDALPESLSTAQEVVAGLVDSLSGNATEPEGRLQKRVSHVLAHSFRVTAASHSSSIDVAWSNLVLLGLVSSPSTRASDRSIQFYPSEWQVICVLAQLERLLHGHVGRQYAKAPSELNLEAIQKITGSLWTQWLDVRSSASFKSTRLEWVVLGSFLYVAGRTRGTRILALCRDYLEDQLTYSHHSMGVQHGVVPRGVVTEYGLAMLLCGSPLFDVCHWMVRTTDDPSAVVHHAIARIAPSDPLLAYELCSISRNVGISVREEDVVSTGGWLTRHGHINYALKYVTDPSLELSNRIEILQVVIQAFLDSPRDPQYADVLDMLTGAIIEVLPLDSAGSTIAIVTPYLLTLLDQGKVSHAIPIIVSAIKLPHDHLSPTHLRTIIGLLVRHRQFELAATLLTRLVKSDNYDTAWCEKVLKDIARGGAHRVASRIAGLLPRSTSRTRTLLHATRYQVEAPTTVSTLKVQSLLSRSDHDDASVLLGVQLLVAAKRMKAAREFFERENPHLTSAGRTAVCNTLIHGYFMRQPHSIKVALRVLQALSANHQFVPDRVTMNILVKGLLQWTEKLDKQGVRTLFDRLILSGYPTGGIYRRGDAPPFNSITGEEARQQGEGTMPLPKVTTPISFLKHAKPLYKMFIKGMYLRGDVHGARRVVGILKAAQVDWEERKRKREQKV